MNLKDDFVKAQVMNVLVSENNFLVLLKEIGGDNRILPISVGIFEANGIIMAMENVRTRRPFTYDIVKTILEGSGIFMDKLLIHKLESNIFFGLLYLKNGMTIKVYDIRPSDGIALSLRFHSPIYVAKKVFADLKKDNSRVISKDNNDIDKKTLKEVKDLDYETDVFQEMRFESIEEKINVLNIKLNDAVKEERYEDAAKLRDMIVDMDKKLKGN